MKADAGFRHPVRYLKHTNKKVMLTFMQILHCLSTSVQKNKCQGNQWSLPVFVKLNTCIVMHKTNICKPLWITVIIAAIWNVLSLVTL